MKTLEGSAIGVVVTRMMPPISKISALIKKNQSTSTSVHSLCVCLSLLIPALRLSTSKNTEDRDHLHISSHKNPVTLPSLDCFILTHLVCVSGGGVHICVLKHACGGERRRQRTTSGN